MTYLAVVLRSTAEHVRKTHKLVNSNFELQLVLTLVALERLAIITGIPEDRVAADEAREILDKHKAQQVAADEECQ